MRTHDNGGFFLFADKYSVVEAEVTRLLKAYGLPYNLSLYENYALLEHFLGIDSFKVDNARQKYGPTTWKSH